MVFEYQALTFLTIFFTLAWIPSSLGKFRSFGWTWISSNREPLKDREPLPWAGRVERAYTNLKDYFPAFVVAILVLGLTNKFDETTKWAAGIFVLGRVLHFIAYGFGNVTLRAIFYFMALASNLFLLIKVFL